MRDIPVGNGSLLVNFDESYQIRDIYFPHVGQENHTAGNPSRFGVWADGKFSWVNAENWSIRLAYLPETLVTDVHLTNEELGVTIVCNDTVASHDNTFIRRVTVKNLRDDSREIRVFFHHDLRIYENNFGDTAYYDPETHALIHYKKHRYFLMNTRPQFASFATGRKAFQGQEGTWRDAEDGFLQGGAITEGSVDSTIGVHLDLKPDEEFEFYYWIAAGTNYAEVKKLNDLVLESGPEEYLDYTANYWRAWVNKNDSDLADLDAPIIDLYKRSLLIIRTQVDNGGAILAANDYDVTERATDHYAYLWTRDGAFVANALDIAGFSHLTRKFFRFCGDIIHPDGYFLQKYNSDGTVASGWHAAWDPVRQEKLVPIQEDETALVLWSLWEHYERYRDIEFANRLYRSVVIPGADFIAAFRDEESQLPLPSWNLWEDRYGIHTYTCASVVAGLRAAANFATLFAEHGRARAYQEAADEVVRAMETYLFSESENRYLRAIDVSRDGSRSNDATIDASLFALFYLGCFPASDAKVAATMEAVSKHLASGDGIARFEGDGYMRGPDSGVGNPWFICTLWLAEFYIASATTIEGIAPAKELIDWVVSRALPSGVLAEQIDPVTGEPVSVSPLTWSHSTFVATVLSYLEKKRQLAAVTL